MVVSDSSKSKGNGNIKHTIQDFQNIQNQIQDINLTDITNSTQSSLADSATSHSSFNTATVPAQLSLSSAISTPPISKLSDWTRGLPDSKHTQFFRDTDWGATLLGPLESWGFALQMHTFTTFSDSRPACLYWYGTMPKVFHPIFELF